MDLQKKYNYSQVENDNHQLKIKNQTHKIITLIIVIALIIFISIFFFLYNKVKNRKENIIRAKDVYYNKMSGSCSKEQTNYC